MGVEIDRTLGLLCGEAQRNSDLNYPTLGLALAALPTASWSILSAQNPLQRWELIEIADTQTLTQSPIKIDKHILCYILGEPSIDSQLTGIIKAMPPLPSIPLPPSHQELADTIVVNWSNGRANSLYPFVQLVGGEITAKSAIATSACQTLGWNIHRMDAHLLPTHPQELAGIMERCLRESILTNSILFLECDEINLADSIRAATISQFIEGLNLPLIVSTQERIPARERSQFSLDVRKLTHSEQRAIWQESLGSLAVKLGDYIDELVVQFNLGTMAIVTASWQIQNQSIDLIVEIDKDDPIPQQQLGESPEQPSIEENKVPQKSGTRRTKKTTPSHNSTTTPPKTIARIQKPQSPIQSKLWDICRDMARQSLDDLAQRIEPTASWDELILPDKEKNILGEIAAQVRQRVKVYHSWGLAGKSLRGLGISALFSGSSGTGKTMASEVIARELRLDLY